ncbi:MAG: isochorismatase family protein [Actinomycetaceae bacterium]|nr:isochorismatase family protein [Actinomycetaceae bacterium]
MSKRALIIVDAQPGLCEGGSLAVEGGNACAERIADFVTEYGDEYDLIVTTQDWHVDPGEHFSDAPDFVDTWPAHCVAGTAEAELHDAIASLSIDYEVKKGEYAAAYSGFEGEDGEGRPLLRVLRDEEISEVDVVGIAESHCVKETALDALKNGMVTRVFSDLTVPVTEELGKAARAEMDEAGVEQLDSEDAFGFYEEPEDEEIPGDYGASADSPEDFDDEYEDDYDDDYDDEDVDDSAAYSDDEDLDSLLADFDDIELDDFGDDDFDFSDDADEGDFDFSDIDYRP